FRSVLCRSGQASAITQQQIEQFMSLSPGQQAALARQYGIDPAAVQNLNGQGTNTQRKSLPTLEQPQVVVPMDPYGQQTPYGQQAAPYGQQTPYGQQAAPYGQQTPYGQQAAPYGQQNPYGQQAAPYSHQAPYGQQGAPY